MVVVWASHARTGSAATPCSCPSACQDLAPADVADSALLICPDAEQPLPASGLEALQQAAGDAVAPEMIGGTFALKVAPERLPILLRQLRTQVMDLERGEVIVEPIHRYDAAAPTPRPTPRDASFGQQWSLHNPAPLGECQEDADINALEAWGAFGPYELPGDETVVLGLVDQGFTFVPDVAPNLWLNFAEANGQLGSDDDGNTYFDDVYGIDARNGDGITGPGAVDSVHGSQVASIMAAVGDNTGVTKGNVAGVVWKSRVVVCATAFSTQELVTCLRYLVGLRDAGANVVAVNISGYGPGCSCCLEREIRRLRDRGVLVVTAAGNSGKDNDVDGSSACPTYPASHRVSNVISVAASTCADQRAAMSNVGRQTVHVAAPGKGVAAIDGKSLVASTNFGGTSAAAPHVTGLIALLKAKEPCLDWRALRNLVLAGGTKLDAFADDTISGRRIRAWDENGVGSMTCAGQIVRRRLFPLGTKTTAVAGGVVPLLFLSIECAASKSPVTVSVFHAGAPIPSETFTLQDDGVSPDEVAGDGEFAGAWKPTVAGTFTLKFGEAAGESLDVVVH